MGTAAHTHNTLESLRRMGFSISVDDFGTGYANLAYLHKFPIKVLKIDKTFVQDMDTNRSVAELIVALCRLMQRQIVAEGVETPAGHCFCGPGAATAPLSPRGCENTPHEQHYRTPRPA